MSWMDTWRAELKIALHRFLPVMGKKGIDFRSGLLATAMLWPVRDALSNLEAQAEIKRICGEDKFLYVIQALPIEQPDPVQIVLHMSERVVASPPLSEAIQSLLNEFVQDIIEVSFLRVSPVQPKPSPSSTSVENVTAGNILINSVQYVWGDLVATVVQQQEAIRTCPQPPNPPAKFGGRDTDYQVLKQHLIQGETSAIAGLRGVGGIGKTTLARQVAHDLYHQDRQFKAVIWTTINQNPNLRNILVSWGKYSDQNYSPDDSLKPDDLKAKIQGMLTEAIAHACGSANTERVLVVLDDVWADGLETARMLMGIIPPHTTVLVTTRDIHVAEKLATIRIKLDYLSDDDAAALLQTYLSEADKETLKPLAKALGGHPLALKLAAENIRINAKSFEASVVEKIEEWIVRYEAGISAASPFIDLKLEEGSDKEDNLSRSLALSYDTLPSDADRQRFRALGILPPDIPFDTTLLLAVWGSTPDKLEDQLLTLLRLGLLDADKQTGKGWYSQHRLLRAYANALLLKAQGEADMVFTGYADIMNQVAQVFHLLPPEQWGVMRPHLPHLHHVGDEWVKRYPHLTDKVDRQRALTFAKRTAYYLFNRREVQRVKWLEMGLELCVQDIDRAFFFGELGMAWSVLGEQRIALDYYEQSLLLKRAVGDRGGEATTLNNVGAVWHALGEQQTALSYYEQALLLMRAMGDERGESGMLSNIGGAWSALGEQSKALDYYEQALVLMRAMGNQNEEAITLNNIGRVWSELGEQPKALNYYEQALPLMQAVGDRWGESTTLNNIGGVWSELGEQPKALDYYEQALPLRRAVGDRRGEATTFSNIGLVWSKLGEEQKALDYYEQALFLMRAVGDRAGEATLLNNIGVVWSKLGEQPKALNYYEKALFLMHSVRNRGGEANTLINIGEILEVLDEWEKALDYYEKALFLMRAVMDRRGEANTLNNIGRVWFKLGKQQKALDYAEKALPLLRVMEDRGGEAGTIYNIGAVWDALGEKRKALDYYEQALPLMRAVGDRGGEATTLNNIGGVWDALGSHQKAIDYFEQALEIFILLDRPEHVAALSVDIALMLDKLGDTLTAIAKVAFALKIMQIKNIQFTVAGISINQVEDFLLHLQEKREGKPPIPQVRTTPQELVRIVVHEQSVSKPDIPSAEEGDNWDDEEAPDLQAVMLLTMFEAADSEESLKQFAAILPPELLPKLETLLQPQLSQREALRHRLQLLKNALKRD